MRSVRTAAEIGNRYFREIKEIWKPFVDRRIIPFCTPMVVRPTVIVIGTNHAGFTRSGTPETCQIAEQFASAMPTINTYLEHDHHFANGLRSVCERADLRVDATWVGTNRCPIQTDSDGLGALPSHPRFEECQARMDDLLHSLIDDIEPKNVLLVGSYACDLFPPTGTPIKDRDWFDMETPSGQPFHVISVKHFSDARRWNDVVPVLKAGFQH